MIKKPLMGATGAACALLLGALMQGDAALAGEVGAGKSCNDNPVGPAGHDACVVGRNSTESDFAVKLCKILDDAGMLQFMGISYGECVQTFSKT
ncbi:MAG: hypothetical protein ACWGPN_10870 [Gammaproteobacteria bacterium]